jgi:anti-sigma regulatory factor (Ser/Thr protein kinase)
MTAAGEERTGGIDAFRHESFLYAGDDEFVGGIGDYVRAGLEAGQAVVVAVPSPRVGMLREALSDSASDIEFIDMEVLGANPARIIDWWQQLADAHATRGGSLRGVGEPAWAGRRDVELEECHLHELLINYAFEGGPGWDLLCPYDVLGLPEQVLNRVAEAHPLHRVTAASASEALPSGNYVPHRAQDTFASPLSPAPRRAITYDFRSYTDVAAVRDAVEAFAVSHGLSQERTDDLVLAGSELATNSIRHGPGWGVLAMWAEPGSLVVQFTDDGWIADPLSGRRAPDADSTSGRGLYLANQLCDLVQLRSSASGTVVRVSTWTT